MHVRFRFVESSIYVEEEKRSESGEVVQSIPVVKSAEVGTYCWYLAPGNYKGYGLPHSMLGASTEIQSRQSHNSTVDMPCSPSALLRSPPREALQVPHMTAVLPIVKYGKVPFLPPVFDGDVIFELPPCGPSSSASEAKNLEGMDKRYDGHPWCKLMTTNIHNSDNLKFRKSYCVGHLVCENANCEYLKRASKRNETEWSGYTVIPFIAGGCPPEQSTLVCMVCKMPPTCLGACKARIYFAYSDNPEMTRAAIHLGHHGHLVARGMYRDSTKVICRLIAEQVAKTPTATNSAITLFASKDFLGHYLFHNGEGEKKMLKAEEMEEVMDRFQYLSSPSIRNVISSFRSYNHGGIIDNIITMKRESKFESIHDSVFPGQDKENCQQGIAL